MKRGNANVKPGCAFEMKKRNSGDQNENIKRNKQRNGKREQRKAREEK